jgi:regulator of protease activity HflC (stomatin/prohibitin superfamily)
MNFEFIGTLGIGALLALGAYVFFVYSQRARGVNAKYSATLIGLLLLLGVGLNVSAAGFVFIQPQERAIVLSPLSPTGYRGEALKPGLQFIVPFVERIERFSIAQAAYTMSRTSNEGAQKGDDSVTARTSDGQEVFVDATAVSGRRGQSHRPVHQVAETLRAGFRPAAIAQYRLQHHLAVQG